MIKVRAAKEDDLLRIAEMTRDLTEHLGSFIWKVENHLKHIKRRFANPKYVYLVAEHNRKVVRFTGAEIKSGRTIYLIKGFVESRYRRRGIMKRMEQALIDILGQKGLVKIDLIVHAGNDDGKATWVALGYKTIRETMRKEI